MKKMANVALMYTGLSLIGGGKTGLAVLYGLLLVVAAVLGFLCKTEPMRKLVLPLTVGLVFAASTLGITIVVPIVAIWFYYQAAAAGTNSVETISHTVARSNKDKEDT